jgi:hypothetical protein
MLWEVNKNISKERYTWGENWENNSFDHEIACE